VYPFRNGDKILVSDRANGLFLLGFQPPPVTVESPHEIFPNPSNGILYFFKDHGLFADYTLHIYNGLGQQLMQIEGKADYTQLNLENYKSGLYYLRYVSNVDDTMFISKFYIQ
ncbi:MAG: T9SS type A sorting domain-containing protein, partial [Bacteroidota bacterium]|nr:T9SS type A sorting domain-containing protein [Bacteroidota bacterium]